MFSYRLHLPHVMVIEGLFFFPYCPLIRNYPGMGHFNFTGQCVEEELKWSFIRLDPLTRHKNKLITCVLQYQEISGLLKFCKGPSLFQMPNWNPEYFHRLLYRLGSWHILWAQIGLKPGKPMHIMPKDSGIGLKRDTKAYL